MSDRIRPSDLPYKGNVPSGVGFCKDSVGNILFDNGSSFSGTPQFPDLASFNAAGGAATYGDGPVWIGGEQYTVLASTLFDADGNVVLIKGDIPTALLNADFSAGYMNLASPVAGKTVVYARASTAWYLDKTGSYKQSASGVPGFGKHGIIVEPARTNVCTNHNAAPNTGVNITASAGTLSAVTDFSAIAAAGLSEIVPSGQLYQLVNGTGAAVTVTFGGQIGSTNNCAFSVFARSFGAPSTLQLSSGRGAVTIPATDKLQRIVSERVTPSATTDQLQISIPAGATVQFILNQLETNGISAAYAATVTSPIVTAGASATRAGVFISIAIANNDIVPANNFSLYAEAMPYSWVEHDSSSNGPVIVAVHQQSPLNRLSARGLVIQKSVAGADETAFDANHRTKLSPTWRTRQSNKLVIRQSSTDGISSYFNGSKGIAEGITSNQSLSDIVITNGFIHIGNQDSSAARQFIGEIRNIQVFDTMLSDEQSVSMTLQNDQMVMLGEFGPVVTDPRRRNRLWALRYNASTDRYDTICYSDNWGISWQAVYTLPTPTGSPTLQLDNAGNFYYLSQGTSNLRRVAADLSSDGNVITWYSSKGPVGGWSWLSWHWAVDAVGNIYTAAYSLDVNTELYIWYSTDNGTTFTRYDTVRDQINSVPQYRHFHSMKVNPFNNKLYLAYGDGVRGTIISKASTGNLLQPGQTFANAWDTLTDTLTPGPTGITFMSDAAYLCSDNVGTDNRLSRINGLNTELVSAMQNPFKLQPVYWLAAKDDLTLIAVTYNEGNTVNPITTKSAIHVLKRDYLGGNWYQHKIIALHDANVTNSDYYEISGDSHFMLDYDSDYVFVTIKDRGQRRRVLMRFTL